MQTTFLGYPRADGSVGIRNDLLVLSATIYANSVCERLAACLSHAIAIVHPLGRCQVKPDLRQTFRTLVGTGRNPNAGGVLVVDHFREEGCTAEEVAHEVASAGKPVEVLNIREAGGAIRATSEGMRLGMEILRDISGQRREEVSVSELLLGLNCGTSDTTSGLSSNLATGYCSDLIIDAGGRSILAEVTEMMGGEHLLAERAVNREVAEKLLAAVRRMEERALASGEDIRGTQPTGDNIAGGLTTIEEKSLGAIKKSGTKPIRDVLEYAASPPKESGLYVMDTPGHGAESITGIAAGGAQILIFSTGGGHTINHPVMVTLRVTGNKVSFEKMRDTMELDVSDIFTGTTVEEAGERIYREVLETASGKLTKCEILKEMAGFAIHRVGPSI